MTDLHIYLFVYSSDLYIKNLNTMSFIILVLRNDSSFVATPTINTFELTIDCYYYSKWRHAHLVF